jgi:hypothetical protein
MREEKAFLLRSTVRSAGENAVGRGPERRFPESVRKRSEGSAATAGASWPVTRPGAREREASAESLASAADGRAGHPGEGRAGVGGEVPGGEEAGAREVVQRAPHRLQRQVVHRVQRRLHRQGQERGHDEEEDDTARHCARWHLELGSAQVSHCASGWWWWELGTAWEQGSGSRQALRSRSEWSGSPRGSEERASPRKTRELS